MVHCGKVRTVDDGFEATHSCFGASSEHYFFLSDIIDKIKNQFPEGEFCIVLAGCNEPLLNP